MATFTHDRINLSGGVLAQPGVLWGNNALQNISITRRTPHNPIQAVGHLGIVDYTSGVVISDLTLDTILVEGCDKADTTGKTNSVYAYAALNVVLGTETYVLTSFAASFTAGQPATANYGFLTPTLASYLDIQAAPTLETGEESSYAVVLGDDGSGIDLVATWKAGFAGLSSTIPVIDNTGALATIADNQLPAGVQSLNVNATINRNNVLDVRTAQPVQFVTTYPVEMTVDMNVFAAPSLVAAGDPAYKAQWDQLVDLAVTSRGVAGGVKHLAGTPSGYLSSSGDTYIKVIGLKKNSEGDSVSVGQYLQYTVQFIAADVLMPLPAAS